jgi:hypothetical protein
MDSIHRLAIDVAEPNFAAPTSMTEQEPVAT